MFLDAIAAFMDGLVSQPETPPVVQDTQAYNQAQSQYGAQSPAFYNAAG